MPRFTRPTPPFANRWQAQDGVLDTTEQFPSIGVGKMELQIILARIEVEDYDELFLPSFSFQTFVSVDFWKWNLEENLLELYRLIDEIK